MPKKCVNVLDLIAFNCKSTIVRASEPIKEPYKPVYIDLVMPKPPKIFSIIGSRSTCDGISLVVTENYSD